MIDEVLTIRGRRGGLNAVLFLDPLIPENDFTGSSLNLSIFWIVQFMSDSPLYSSSFDGYTSEQLLERMHLRIAAFSMKRQLYIHDLAFLFHKR